MVDGDGRCERLRLTGRGRIGVERRCRCSVETNMTDEDALKENDRQEKRFAAEWCGCCDA